MTLLAPVALSDVAPPTTRESDERARLLGVLKDAANRRDWVGIHAGEALIDVGHPQDALVAFAPQKDTTEPKYRIGVWRILARAEATDADRASYVERIRAVFMNEAATDRVHAVETLAKLAVPISGERERRAVDAMAADPAAGPFALWRLALAGEESAVGRLEACARGDDAVGRSRAQYVLSRLAGPPEIRDPAEERKRLERQLSDADEDRRVAAALGLLRLHDASRQEPATRTSR